MPLPRRISRFRPIRQWRAWLWHRMPPRLDWIFALRTAAAGFLALGLSFAVGLTEPQWAIMTVFIVAQPYTGMVLAKGAFRVVGTLAGAGAAVLLVRLLGGQPVLFVIAMAAWLALCTFLAGLLRNTPSYGVVLSGYTAGIIGYPALDHPALAQSLAVARCTEILLGIACAGLASALILPRPIRPVLVQRLRGALRDVVGYAAGVLAAAPAARLAQSHRALVVESQAIDSLRGFALAERPHLRRRSRQIQHIIGFLMSALSDARLIQLHAVPTTPALADLRRDACEVFERIVAQRLGRPSMALAGLTGLRARIEAAGETLDQEPSDRALLAAAILSALGELVDTLIQALTAFDALVETSSVPLADGSGRLSVHVDPWQLLRNGARAGLAALLIGLLWRASNWPEGAGVVAIVAALTGLFASHRNGAGSSMMFFRGTAMAVPFAFLCGQVLLPVLPGFFSLVAVLTPVLVVAGLGMAQPRTMGVATGFGVLFLAMVSPRLHMIWEPEAFLGGVVAVLGGILICAAVFKSILPVRSGRATRHLLAAMRDDLARLCVARPMPSRLAFESRMYDRVAQLLPDLPADAAAADGVLDGALGALHVGLELLRLRTVNRPELTPLLARLAAAFTAPPEPARLAGLVSACRSLAANMAEPGHPDLAVGAALRMVAVLLADHPAMFSRDEPPDLSATIPATAQL